MTAPANITNISTAYTRLTERALNAITSCSTGSPKETARLMVRAFAMVAREFLPKAELVKHLRDLATEIERGE